jgi:quinol monooxygenase YgiN
MVGGLKILTVKSGLEREFEALFAELRNDMHKHEPGCVLYSLLKSRKSSSAGRKRCQEPLFELTAVS